MRVFITGASGYIGHAVAKAFRSKGHTVYGLVRSEESARLLGLDEIWPIIGDLHNPETYSSILNEVEVVVHCAFENSDKGVEVDNKTIDTVLGAFSKSSLPKAFVYTSGVWVYGASVNQIVDEATPLNPIDLVKWRPVHEEKVLKASSPHLRTVVLRPGCVYGGVGGLTSIFFTTAENGSVSIVGDGSNRWAMVHLLDLAYAYVSVVEKELTNVVLNVIDDSSFTVKEMAEAVARAAGIPGKVNSFSLEEAQQQFGSLIPALMMNQQVNNARIKRLLHWNSHHAPFVNEIDIYYNAWKVAQQVEVF